MYLKFRHHLLKRGRKGACDHVFVAVRNKIGTHVRIGVLASECGKKGVYTHFLPIWVLFDKAVR